MARALRPIPSSHSFFLAHPPEGGTTELLAGEADHASRVLRLQAGDLCLGLDGRGRRWPLEVVPGPGSKLGVRAVDAPEEEAEPGQRGAPLPWLEVAVAWPRKSRAEPMIGHLVQLGAAAITPLAADYRGAAPIPQTPPSRWRKLCREACKQSGRLWLPELAEATDLATLLERVEGSLCAAFDPDAGLSFDAWVRSLRIGPRSAGIRSNPIVLLFGPEGGWSPAERELLLLSGASSVWLGPHVLRIETAAEAGLAVAAHLLGNRLGGPEEMGLP